MYNKVLCLAILAVSALAAPQHEHGGYYSGHSLSAPQLQLSQHSAPAAQSYSSFSVSHEPSQPALHTVAIAAPVAKVAVAPAVAKYAVAPAVAKFAVGHAADSYSSLSFGHAEEAHQVQYAAAAAPILQKYTELHSAPVYRHYEAAPQLHSVQTVHAAPSIQYAAAAPVYQKYTEVQAAPAVHYAAPQVQQYAQVHAAPAFQHSAPTVHYQLQQPAVHAVHAVHAAPAVKAVETHVEQYSHPKYEFSYGVKDGHTGDMKSQHEVRDGDVVKGSYSVADPDGTTRTVHYTADDHNGFNAVVERSGHAQHPQQVQHVAKAVVAAPVVSKQLVALQPEIHGHYQYAPHH